MGKVSRKPVILQKVKTADYRRYFRVTAAREDGSHQKYTRGGEPEAQCLGRSSVGGVFSGS